MAGKQIDWEQVRPHYEAGIRSLKDIGAEFGVSAPGVLKAAERLGWARDLGARIRLKAEAKVNAAALNAAANVKPSVHEQRVVELNAEMQYRIRMEHRSDIQRARRLFQQLLEEQEALCQGAQRTLLEQLAAQTEQPQGKESTAQQLQRIDRARKLMSRLTTGPERIDNARKLASLLETVIRLERQAFGIDESTPAEKPRPIDWENVSPQDAIEAYRRIVGGN